MSGHEQRAAQVAVMAEPRRLELLARLIAHPSGQPTAADLAAPDLGLDEVRADLAAMIDVDLVAPVGFGAHVGHRPTHDALARFGGAAIGRAQGEGRQVVPASDHTALLDRVTEDLRAAYSHVLGPETVDRYVRESYALLAARASVRRFLPALTARFASERLAAVAAEQGSGVARDVLFVCVHNAGRSQIAAALLRALAGTRVRVRTAGSVPAGAVHPTVRAELARRGLETLVDFPRPLTEDVVRASHVVVTMGCGDACPVIPGRRYLDWPVPDPSGRSAVEVAAIVDDLEHRVRGLLEELG